jgi:hypothetical protein
VATVFLKNLPFVQNTPKMAFFNGAKPAFLGGWMQDTGVTPCRECSVLRVDGSLLVEIDE